MLIQRYFAYGLNIASELVLPGLEEGPAVEPDVLIEVRQEAAWGDCPASGDRVDVTAGQTRICCSEAAVEVCNGREVFVSPAPKFNADTVGLMLVGPVMAALLHQRGLLVLHASATSRGGFTVAFMGPSGRGKSTTAAALHRRGFGVVADDIVAVDLTGGQPMVIPGSPQLRLTPDSGHALGWEESRHSHPQQEKWIVRDRSGLHPHSPIALNLLCEVLPGDEAMLEDLRPPEALMAVMANGYLGESVWAEPRSAAACFEQCTRLCTRVDVKRLTRGSNFNQLLGFLDSLVPHW